ncbi:MAG: tRNA pseudouridine(38-40) synthase TruA [Saprospiraceae bacterium]
MRYALKLSYDGTNFQGWQKQLGDKRTVQGELERCINILCKSDSKIEITGCGRTDTGVHAINYIAHFDWNKTLPPDFVYHLNSILPTDIAIDDTIEVDDTFHARYDAIQRRYEYHLHGFKAPFLDKWSFRIKSFDKLEMNKLNEAAGLISSFHSFYPFCLSDSGVKNYNVTIFESYWKEAAEKQLVFTISANRFLRGMVRLVTGMCVNVATGQLEMEAVKNALTNQTLLPKSLSLPPHGLYLVNVKYENLDIDQSIEKQ